MWVSVDNKAGNELTFNGQGTPGTPLNIVFNNTPGGANSVTTAQVNAFIHTNKIHDFYRDRSGTWSEVDISMPCNVNLTQTCNAFWDGSSINFFQAGGGCPNTAYSDVVAHEYGHFVVQALGLAQGGFGEGFGDTGALLLYDGNGILGRDFMGPGTKVRNIAGSTVMYPCSNPDPHVCGEVLGGVWWGIRTRFGAAYGSQPGLELVRQLFVDWMLVTTGGSGSNSANADTAIEILTLNDDDGYLGNGTPDYSKICQSFAAKAIPCPPAPPLGIQFPSGLPTLGVPDVPTEIFVNILDMSRIAAVNTGKIFYRINGGAYTSANMTQLSPTSTRPPFRRRTATPTSITTSRP
jgi:hypothetical protein